MYKVDDVTHDISVTGMRNHNLGIIWEKLSRDISYSRTRLNSLKPRYECTHYRRMSYLFTYSSVSFNNTAACGLVPEISV